MTYIADEKRYNSMIYNRCGDSGLLLPAVSLGLYRNFGEKTPFKTAEKLIEIAFDNGITHFDLANNYGEPNGSAEKLFGQILKKALNGYRDEMIIATKAGYDMWPGPYGDGGSKKYMLASLDQSLKRLDLDYVDIYYSHRYDPDTPLEETVSALGTAVRSGKAVYAGVSNYPVTVMREVIKLFKQENIPFIAHQPQYSMFLREPEQELFPLLEEMGVGAVVYQALFQGLLTTKYVDGIPRDSRLADKVDSISTDQLTEERTKKVLNLQNIASERNQTVAQLAIAWALKRKPVSSVVIGVRNIEQLNENIGALNNTTFSNDELLKIDRILA